jgi:hypothetical protein
MASPQVELEDRSAVTHEMSLERIDVGEPLFPDASSPPMIIYVPDYLPNGRRSPPGA